MKMVVDVNFLQDEKLTGYFRENRESKVVLNDYASMEMHKGNTLKSIFPSMKILSKFPKRVVVLRGTREIAPMLLDAKSIASCMVDREQTKGFREYCHLLRLGRAGDPAIVEQLLERGKNASQHIDGTMLDAVGDFRTWVTKLEESYSLDLLSTLRSGEALTVDMHDRLIKDVMSVAGLMFDRHPRIKSLPEISRLPDHFVFRYSICVYWLCVHWIADRGGAGNIRKADAKKLRNDLVDVSYVTYATYFDGLLTNDKQMRKLYEVVCFVLKEGFGVH